MIVVDSSVIVHFLLHSTASGELSRVIADQDVLAAPAVIDLEVLNTLRKLVQSRQINSEVAGRAVENYGDIRLELHDIRPMLKRVWDFRNNVTAYDAAYLALAEQLNVPFLTRDARLARSAPSNIDVHLR